MLRILIRRNTPRKYGASTPIRVMRRLKNLLRQCIHWPFVYFGSRYPLCARLYYAFLNSEFAYEQRAFLYGRRKYAASLVNPATSMAFLRRNIHRLEKGLLMMPRRVPFAKDYIAETLDGYSIAAKAGGLEQSEFKWASDVLSEYFSVCGHVAEIAELETKFRELNNRMGNPGEVAYIPYHRDPTHLPGIDIDTITQLARYRRSVRWFLPKKVPRKLIDKAIVAAGYSPSACNRQPYEFRIIDDMSLVSEVSMLPLGTVGYAHNIPCLIIIVGKHRNYFHERDRHLIYIDSSLAAMSLIFALECQGVSSCCINWPEIVDKDVAMREFLKLDFDERPVMCIAVGYADTSGMVAYSAKKPLNVIRRYNFE